MFSEFAEAAIKEESSNDGTLESEVKEISRVLENVSIIETNDLCDNGPVIVKCEKDGLKIVAHISSRDSYDAAGLSVAGGVGFGQEVTSGSGRKGVSRIRILSTAKSEDLSDTQARSNAFLDATNTSMSGFVPIKSVVEFFWPAVQR